MEWTSPHGLLLDLRVYRYHPKSGISENGILETGYSIASQI